MRILAIDPGGTTGIAWGEFKPGVLQTPGTAAPQGFGAAAAQFDMLIKSFKPDLVVIEKFTISAATIKKSTSGSNTAIELIGVARYLTSLRALPFEEQKPVDAKNFCTDEKLKKIGWYIPGPDHKRDAMRHLLLASVRHKVLDLSILVSS